tara:strand:+ start:1592 stop:3247 length:1656 start_codon:yes stop_codon:yes gene_type:complete
VISTIFYHPEAFTTSGPKLMGRNVAGKSFLRGFFSYSSNQEFWALLNTKEHFEQFTKEVVSSGRTEKVKAIYKESIRELSDSGLIFYPGPDIANQSFYRASLQCHRSWSICGITHTTSSSIAMDAITNLLTSAVYPWDALICTSQAAKKNVLNVLQAQTDFLQSRLGISKVVLPQLPVIPLGIHTSDFEFSLSQKQTSRESLGIEPQAIVVLFVGRLSFHAKAHPLAMYQALEAASKIAEQKVVLIECGWHANDYISRAFHQASSKTCPNIHVINLDGRKAENQLLAWSSADVFCSLSDNIQETFGITPVEAMASGIPVVVSDWDGYKDTVRDGVDGFRIPTLMPPDGSGNDLAYRHAIELDSYDMYCGNTCSLIAVDIQAATKAFVSLFQSSELRCDMGNSGRQRAKEQYDWKNIIMQYEALWRELSNIRTSKTIELNIAKRPWPNRIDPFHAFDSYPTNILSSETLLTLVDTSVSDALNRLSIYRQLDMINFAKVVIPHDDEIKAVLQAASFGPLKAILLLKNIPPHRHPFVFRSLSWLVKLGILSVCF